MRDLSAVFWTHSVLLSPSAQTLGVESVTARRDPDFLAHNLFCLLLVSGGGRCVRFEQFFFFLLLFILESFRAFVLDELLLFLFVSGADAEHVRILRTADVESLHANSALLLVPCRFGVY